MPYRLGQGYTLALLVTAAFLFALAALTLRHRDERASVPLFGFLVAIGVWCLGDALRVAAPTEGTVLFWNRVAYLGIVFVPPTLLSFVLSYTGRRRWLDRRYVLALGSVSVLAYAFVLDDEAVAGTPAATVFADYPAIRDYLETGDGDDTITVTIDGETRHYDVDVSRMTDAFDTYVGRVIVFTDVTDRVNQRRRLRDRTEELERVNERLDQFASVVSHDLRSPLSVVVTRAELARVDEDPAPHLDAVVDATERMETIVDDVLTLARHGEAVGETEPVALEEAARLAWSFVDSDDATLTVASAATVAADPDRLQEVFENLFRNAIEHGGDDVHVRLGTLSGGFFVEDDGPGVPDSERDRVFDPGFTTGEDGIGLGLHIVSTIVEAHGWEISVTDGTDGGARFEITGVDTA